MARQERFGDGPLSMSELIMLDHEVLGAQKSKVVCH